MRIEEYHFFVPMKSQYALLRQPIIRLCTLIGERTLLLAPISWGHMTEYADVASSCSIPLDAMSVTKGMPFTSISVVSDKMLRAHRDTNNMKGSTTFVS